MTSTPFVIRPTVHSNVRTTAVLVSSPGLCYDTPFATMDILFVTTDLAHWIYPNRFVRRCWPAVAPQVNTFMNERDTCNFYFIANRCMHKAFFQDLRSWRGLCKHHQKWGRAAPEKHRVAIGTVPREIRDRRREETRHRDGGALGAPPRFRNYGIEGVKPRGPQHRFRIGAAMNVFLITVSTDFTRLLAGMER